MGTPRTVVAKLVGRALRQLEPLKDVRRLGSAFWQSGGSICRGGRDNNSTSNDGSDDR